METRTELKVVDIFKILHLWLKKLYQSVLCDFYYFKKNDFIPVFSTISKFVYTPSHISFTLFCDLWSLK